MRGGPGGGPRGETLLDRQIRDAMAEGAFDTAAQGAPLPNEENPYAAEWGLAFHVLRNAGFAATVVEADKRLRDLLARRGRIVARGRRRRSRLLRDGSPRPSSSRSSSA